MSGNSARQIIVIAGLALFWLCLPHDVYAEVYHELKPCDSSSTSTIYDCDGVSSALSTTDGAPEALDIYTCADPTATNPPPAGAFTALVVACIQNSVLVAAIGSDGNGGLLGTIATYMQPITGAAIVLAVAIFGMRVAGGEQEIAAKGAGVLLRLGLVLYYSYSMNTIAIDIFGTNGNNGILNELSSITGSGPPTNPDLKGVSYNSGPWATIDGILGGLLGIGSGTTLAHGIMGLIGSALTSSFKSPSLGSTLFVPAVMAAVTTMLFIFDIVYTYLKAIILLGFLLIISPFLIPLALFNYTDRFLSQLIKLILMPLITVTMLMAFVNMSVIILQTSASNVITDLGGDATTWGKLSMPVSSNLEIAEPNQNNAEKKVEQTADTANNSNNSLTLTPTVAGNLVPYLAGASDQTAYVPGIDFSNVQPSQRNPTGGNSGTIALLAIDFASLFLLSAVLKYMLTIIPDVAGNIAGVVSKVGFHQSPPMKERFQQGVQDIKTGAGAAIGGVMGGMAGAKMGGAMGGSRGSGLGRAMGGLAGAFAGMKAAIGR